MEFFEKSISNLIESQFPSFYEEEGPVFVNFVKSYYEWLEQNSNVLFHSRRLMEYRDIDTTIDGFLIHFKNKYLNGIQYDTAVDTRRIVKRSLDLYRSKGSERSVDLFFKSIFGVKSSVYYPGRDIFKASSAQWIVPKYLEVQNSSNIKNFIGLQIRGIDSGAVAFVEKYVRKRASNSTFFNDIYYITNIVGDFRTGERIVSTKTGEVGPVIIGSMNSLEIISGGTGYSVGDIVSISSSSNGRDGKARVSGVSNVSGRVSFSLSQGGWGYNSNSQIIISDKVLTVSETDNSNGTFETFETVIQPMAYLEYNTASGDQFLAGDTLYKLDSNGDTIITALILNVESTDGSNGTLLVSTSEGNFGNENDLVDEDDNLITTEIGVPLSLVGSPTTENTYFYGIKSLAGEDNQPNSEVFIVLEDEYQILFEDPVNQANLVLLTDATASGLVVYASNTVTLSVSNIVSSFSAGEVVYQTDGIQDTARATVVLVSNSSASGISILLSNTVGYFVSGSQILSKNTAVTGSVSNIITNIGLFDVSESFVDYDGNRIVGSVNGADGTVTRVSTGVGAEFVLSNTFLYEEIVGYNTDIVGDYFTVQLDDPDYGFPTPGIANLESIIGNTLTYDIGTFGKISEIILTNPGSNYDTSPYVLVYEPDTYRHRKRNFVVTFDDATGNFIPGEALQQGTRVVGTVLPTSNSSVLYIDRTTMESLNYHADVITEIGDELDDEDGSQIREEGWLRLTGTSSGTSARIISFKEDELSSYIGLNSIIIANTAVSRGSVSSLEVIDSGLGYFDGEAVSFPGGSASVRLEKQGTGSGFWKENNSVLSGNKYLQDGEYYQEFSYEIRSPIPLDKYEEVLRDIIHIAGTKYFARFVLEGETEVPSDISMYSMEIESYLALLGNDILLLDEDNLVFGEPS